ncbi:MAG TPA: cobalamin biosynthesis protein CbiG [Syntrophaceae bacterium]|nr:cobalamin biosynthesis protein CbiG [Syntrophaceae bacterium]HCX01466.1 cobalamin biosynthesis protein CbiG [Syntrophaceae bacterium]
MSVALITLSQEGLLIADALTAKMNETRIFVHGGVPNAPPLAEPFDGILELTARIFGNFDALVFITPCGVAVRAIAPHVEDKHNDPAVVCIDAGGRYAISLLGGHEAGANDLACVAANVLNAEPVVTTTTEVLKNLIVGIGCRRGVTVDAILDAVEGALERCGGWLDQVRLLASADIKADEEGLLEAAHRIGVPLRLISSNDIRAAAASFQYSEFVQAKVDLPAVAEPSALLAGRRTTLILGKTVFNGVTVAVARESFSWSASGREIRWT